VLDAFKGCLTPEINATVIGSSMHTDFLIPGRVTS
jgi:hypothetical protein